MPRIDRHTVEFNVDDQLWVARFSHLHNDKEGMPGVGTTVVKHITMCTLGTKTEGDKVSQGTASCSIMDDYNWRIGIKLAFQRAVKVALGDTEGDYATVRQQWGKFMSEFFKEMRVRG